MNIVVFGATGATGSILTKMLLEKGHSVTAYVRNPEKMSLVHEKLQVVKGDVYDNKSIERVLKGQDAVVSCLGSNTTKASDQLTRMAQSITSAMVATGVRRVVYMATAGIEDEFSGIINAFIRMVLGRVIDDHRGAAELYKQNGFDYTILRPMQLIDGSVTGEYDLAEHGLPHSKKAISRANVAYFIVQVLEDERYYRKSVALAE